MIKELINHEIQRLSRGKNATHKTINDHQEFNKINLKQNFIIDYYENGSGDSPLKKTFLSNSNKCCQKQQEIIEKTKDLVIKSKANEVRIKDLEN